MSIDDYNITTDNVNSYVQFQSSNINKHSEDTFECRDLLRDSDSSVVFDSDSDVDENPNFRNNGNNVIRTASHNHKQGAIVIEETRCSKYHDLVKQSQIDVQTSSDLTIGTKYVYQGPVTIKQFLIDKNRERTTGVDYKGLETSNRDTSTTNGMLLRDHSYDVMQDYRRVSLRIV